MKTLFCNATIAEPSHYVTAPSDLWQFKNNMLSNTIPSRRLKSEFFLEKKMSYAVTMTIGGGTLRNLGWNVRGLNVGLSSPSAEDPEAGGATGDRHRKLGSAGEPSSGILRYIFVHSITILILHIGRPR